MLSFHFAIEVRYKQHSEISQIHGVGGIWGLGSRNLNLSRAPARTACLSACCSRFRAALHGGPTPNGDGVNKIRVVDDRKLAWRAHPWPAWAVGRLRPLACLRSFPSCVASATPTECFHVVVSSSGVRRL